MTINQVRCVCLLVALRRSARLVFCVYPPSQWCSTDHLNEILLLTASQVCLELEQTWMESGVSEDAVSGHIQVGCQTHPDSIQSFTLPFPQSRGWSRARHKTQVSGHIQARKSALPALGLGLFMSPLQPGYSQQDRWLAHQRTIPHPLSNADPLCCPQNCRSSFPARRRALHACRRWWLRPASMSAP